MSDDILARILARKHQEVEQRSRVRTLDSLRARAERAPRTRGFADAIASRVDGGQTAVIAEIKKASPSKGLIRKDFDPATLARQYEAGGAACLSVLTDVDFFQGSNAYLSEARDACALPVLRKDFIVDEYQIFEARTIGADCVLLIVAALDELQLVDYSNLAQDLGMDVLIEVHDVDELEKALQTDARLIGVNNRNLRTFNVDLQTSLTLKEGIPSDRIAISESGIHSRADVERLTASGIQSFLIGEHFMRERDPGVALRQLMAY